MTGAYMEKEDEAENSRQWLHEELPPVFVIKYYFHLGVILQGVILKDLLEDKHQ